MERIVVPLDGSRTSEAILPQVKRLLKRTDAELVLTGVATLQPVDLALTLAQAALAGLKARLDEIRAELEGQGVRASVEAALGDPARVILDVVRNRNASLIAMATHGQTGLARLLMGSVAEQVMRNTPVPMLVVRPFSSYELEERPRTEDRPIVDILMAVDGSELSNQALPAVKELAALFESRVRLLRVLRPEEDAAKLVEAREAAEAGLQEMVKSLGHDGVEAEAVIGVGDAVDVIQKTATLRGADLIAMTTHGRSGLSRLAMGSVTERLLRTSKVPMLIVRARKPVQAEPASRGSAPGVAD